MDVTSSEKFVKRNAEIKIGDWCIFRVKAKRGSCEDDSNFVVGNILSFRYMNAKSKTDKIYSWDFCSVSHKENSRGVEVLAAWHNVNENNLIHHVTSFMNIESYIANVSCELIEKNVNGNIYLSQTYASSFDIFLKNWSK